MELLCMITRYKWEFLYRTLPRYLLLFPGGLRNMYEIRNIYLKIVEFQLVQQMLILEEEPSQHFNNNYRVIQMILRQQLQTIWKGLRCRTMGRLSTQLQPLYYHQIYFKSFHQA